MVQYLMGCFRMERSKGMVNLSGQMGLNIRVISIMMRQRDLGSLDGQMGNSMMEVGWVIG